MVTNNAELPWFLHGIGSLVVPAWICDPAGRLVEINRRGEELLGLRSDEVCSRPCSDIFAGLDPSGGRVFHNHADTIRGIEEGAIETPIRIRRESTGSKERWLEILPLVLRDREREGVPWLVLLGRDAHAFCLMEQYLERVAARSGAPQQLEWKLTPREREVLERMVRDEDSYEIARKLGLTYATVRNHVQRILIKLQAHSIPEAVARYILRLSR